MPKSPKKSPTETPKVFTPGMSSSGMPDIQDQGGMSNRGRPPITDTAKLKTSTMTICLTSEVKDQLHNLAINQNQKPAAMGRILIEAGIRELKDG